MAIQPKYPYTAVEAALAEVLNIPEDGLKAFRARIRHIRNLGIPAGDRPGSGKKLFYSFHQVVETAFILVLQNAGFTPRIAISMAPKILLSLQVMNLHTDADVLGDIYVAVMRLGSGSTYQSSTVLHGLTTFLEADWSMRIGSYAQVMEMLPKWLEHSDTASLVNVSQLARKIEKAIAGVAN
jgi:hypothetical protein